MSIADPDREAVLKILQEKCGFSFQEDNLSPATRKEIGSLTKKFKEIKQLSINVSNMKKSVNNRRDVVRIVKLVGGSSLFISLIYSISAILGGITYFIYAAPYILTFLLCGVIVWIIANIMNTSLYEPRAIKYTNASETYSTLRKEWPSNIRMLSEKIVSELSGVHEEKAQSRAAELRVNFSTILQAVGEIGLIIQNFRCENCGGPIALPDKGSSVRCSHCGEIIEAAEVLEKINAILNPKE